MTHMARARRPTSASTRSLISWAALLVKVIARIWPGWAAPVATRCAMRWVSTRVLPLPAPARIRSGPPACRTASRWGSFRPSRKASGAAVALTQARIDPHPAVGWRPMGLCDEVRRECAEIASSARFVSIDMPKLGVIAPSAAPPLDSERHYLEGPREDVAAYLLTLDSINFGSGWFPTLRKRPGSSGYYTIAWALADRFRSHGPWSRAELLPPGEEEREIRACALHACELIARELRVAPRTLDTWLWNRGQAPRYKAVPRHRTRTVFY